MTEALQPSPRLSSMLKTRFPRMAALLLCIALPVAAAEEGWIWKPGELYRFRYEKSVTVKQTDPSGAPSERTTSIEAILILEIRTVTPESASALMRFDSPRVTVPAALVYSSQSDKPSEPSDEKAGSIGRAIDAAIRTARFGVTVFPDGSLRIDSRTPEQFDEWFKEIYAAANWRRKSRNLLNSMLEDDLGLKPGGIDREMLFCLKPLPASEALPKGQELRPVRVLDPQPKKEGSNKLHYSFKRQLPNAAQTPFTIPSLMNSEVKMTVKSVATEEGKATFDSRLGILDALSETYTVKSDYTLRADTLAQELQVKIQLKRLAPPVQPAE